MLALVAVLAVAPWTIRNERTLHHFVPVSTQLGSALAGTYNDEARTDPMRPCVVALAAPRAVVRGHLLAACAQTNEAVLEKHLRHRAERYALDHPAYVAEVAFWTTRARPRPRRAGLGPAHRARR